MNNNFKITESSINKPISLQEIKSYCGIKSCDVRYSIDKIGRQLEFRPQLVPFGKYNIISLLNWQLLFFVLRGVAMKNNFKTVGTKKLLSQNHADCTEQVKVYGQEKNCDVRCLIEKGVRFLNLDTHGTTPIRKQIIISLLMDVNPFVWRVDEKF